MGRHTESISEICPRESLADAEFEYELITSVKPERSTSQQFGELPGVELVIDRVCG